MYRIYDILLVTGKIAYAMVRNYGLHCHHLYHQPRRTAVFAVAMQPLLNDRLANLNDIELQCIFRYHELVEA